MKQFVKGFALRGLVAAGGGPLVLAIIYGVLGETGAVVSLTPREVSIGILSVLLLAFIVAGMNAIYQVEQLPLLMAILLHGIALYAAYILIYIFNGWLQEQLIPILTFTVVFVVGYAIIWLVIYSVTKHKTQKINVQLQSKS